MPERGDLYIASRRHEGGGSSPPAVRVLLRFHDPSAGGEDALGPLQNSIELLIAELIVRAQGGRLTLGAIRRIRINEEVAYTKNYPRSPLEKFTNLLSADKELIGNAFNLLEKYLQSGDESWRATWMLYMLIDAHPIESRLRQKLSDLVDFAASEHGQSLAGLWARSMFAHQTPRPELEELHELGYFEGGIRCYGSDTN